MPVNFKVDLPHSEKETISGPFCCKDEPGNTSPTMGNGVIYFRVGRGNGHNRVAYLSVSWKRVPPG